MDERSVLIFAFGCVVFGITVASAFIALVATDHPERPK